MWYNGAFAGFSGRRRKRSTKDEEDEEDKAKRLLLKILELISAMDPSQHLNIGTDSETQNQNTIGPCLLYRLCEVPTKLWRDKNEIQLLNLVNQYRYVHI